MAIFHFKTTPISRSNGHSATAKIAYVCRTKIKDEQTGKIHNYSSEKSKSDLITTGIHYKIKDIDTWRELSSQEVWNKAERAENRKDSRVAREILVALPNELNTAEQAKLTRMFCQTLANNYQCFVEFAIHNEKDGNNNVHAHIVLSTRKLDITNPNLFTEKINLELSQKKCKELGIKCTDDQIKDLRKEWEILVNKRLKNNGFEIEISCEKKKDRELVKKHLGKDTNALEKKGIQTESGNYNRQIDKVIELDTKIYNDANKLAKINAEIEQLENKQKIQLSPIIEKPQQILALIPPKITEVNQSNNELKKRSYIDTGKLFDIARQHNDFFNRTNNGWENKTQSVCVIENKVYVQPEFSNSDVILAIDVAQSKYETLSIKGSEDFEIAIYKEIVINPKYQDIKVVDIEKLEKVRNSLLCSDVLNFYERTYPTFIEKIKQNGVLENIGDNKREIIDLKIATSQQIQVAMTDIINRSEQKKSLTELYSKPLTVNSLMKYYESISPEIIKEARETGYVTVQQVGYEPSHTSIRDDIHDLLEALEKATGHKVLISVNTATDKILRYYEKIDPELVKKLKDDGGLMVNEDGYVPAFRTIKTDFNAVLKELAKRTGKDLPQEMLEQIKISMQAMSKGISR
jgi:hypothetical protein